MGWVRLYHLPYNLKNLILTSIRSVDLISFEEAIKVISNDIGVSPIFYLRYFKRLFLKIENE